MSTAVCMARGSRWTIHQTSRCRSTRRRGSQSGCTQCMQAKLTLIATDVDGTLMNSKHMLSDGVANAVQAAAAVGVPTVVATGKARGPWADEVLPRLGSAMPGVFLQGLLIYDSHGELLYERALEEEVALQVIELADKHGLSLTAYCGNRILCAQRDYHTDRLLLYKEPTPEAMGPMQHNVVGKIAIHKLLFMGEQEKIDAVRPHVQARLAGAATLTTAVTGMLEVLPLNASKGAGLAWLLERLGVDPGNVMAIGDGENDLEMLQLAGVGVAMGNAGPQLKAVADHVVGTNDQDGVAEAIQKFILTPSDLQLQGSGVVHEN